MTKGERGRKTLYTPDLGNKILDRLAAGESLRAICRDSEIGVSAPCVRGWVVEDVDGFAERYARARDIGLDEKADELEEIADDGSNDWMDKNDPQNPGYSLNGEHVQRSRLRVEARKWYLSKLAPKKYGDKIGVEHSGSIAFENMSESDILAELRALTQHLHATDSQTGS